MKKIKNKFFKKNKSKLFFILIFILIIIAIVLLIFIIADNKNKLEKNIKKQNEKVYLYFFNTNQCYWENLNYLINKTEEYDPVYFERILNYYSKILNDNDYLEKKRYCDSIYTKYISNVDLIKGWNDEKYKKVEELKNSTNSFIEELRKFINEFESELINYDNQNFLIFSSRLKDKVNEFKIRRTKVFYLWHDFMDYKIYY